MGGFRIIAAWYSRVVRCEEFFNHLCQRQVPLSPTREASATLSDLWQEISCLDAESGITWLTMRPNAKLRRVTESHRDRYWENALATTNIQRRQMLNQFREEVPFPHNLPAYSSLLVDSSDQVWAGVFHAPGDDYREWHVFKEGRWDTSILVPPNLQVMDVRGHWLIGVDEDELGVESLAIFDLEAIL